VKAFYQSRSSVSLTLRKWSSAFENRSKPSQNMLRSLIDKFERTGSVQDDNPERIRSARTPELVEQVET